MCQSCSSPANAFLHDLPKVSRAEGLRGSMSALRRGAPELG